MGRPTLLDDLKAKRILDAIRLGHSRRNAAIISDTPYSTLKNWIARGRKREEPYRSFLARLRKADVEAEEKMIVMIRTGAERWQAAAWWLERTHRARYRRPVQPAEQQQDLSEVPEEQLVAAMAREVEARKARANG